MIHKGVETVIQYDYDIYYMTTAQHVILYIIFRGRFEENENFGL
jgi:hypothetical protein